MGYFQEGRLLTKGLELKFPWEEKKESKDYLPSERKDWDSYWMGLLNYIKKQSPCLKKKVASVLVKDRRLIAMGYNGPPSGIPHCESCIRMDEDLKSYDLCPAIHAEINCIAMCARFGISAEGSTLYCEYFPCKNCCGTIINAGVSEVVYDKPPVDEVAMLLSLRAGVKVRKWNG